MFYLPFTSLVHFLPTPYF